jgi:transposase
MKDLCGLAVAFGLVVPKSKGRIFEANVRRLLDEEHALAAVVLPLLEAWCGIRNRPELDRLLLRKVRGDANCRRLMKPG